MTLKLNNLICQVTLSLSCILLGSMIQGCAMDSTVPASFSNVRNIYVTMTESGLERLDESVFYGDEVPCLVRIDQGEPQLASLEVRGALSLQLPKKNFSFKLPDQAYALDASYLDPSVLRNRMVFEAYRDIGIPAPESHGAALFINDIYHGYYSMLDRYSEDQLRSFYSTDDIELYRCNFGNMGYDSPLYSSSEKRFPDRDDFTSLIVLMYQLANLPDSQWISWVSENFNVEQTARYFAVHHYYAVTDTSSTNFNIAVVDGKYLYLPWDNEASMRINTDGEILPSHNYPFHGTGLLQRRLLMTGSPVRQRYEELITSYYIDENFLIDGENLRTIYMKRYQDLMLEVNHAVAADHFRFWNYEDFLQEETRIMDFFSERAGEFPVY